MKKYIVAALIGASLMAAPAMASQKGEATTCSSTSSCLPNLRMVPTAQDGTVYRVRFVEVIGADVYRWTAGPWFNLEGAQRAANRLGNASGVPDSSINIQANSGTGWQNYAD